MTGKDVAFVWFTYELDAKLACLSVASVRRVLPDAALVVIEDAASPIDRQSMEFFAELGVDVKNSHWERGGKLTGRPALLGVIQALSNAAEQHSRLMAFKIDSDTVILDATWLRQMSEEAPAMGLYTEGRYFGEDRDPATWMGMCYGLSKKLLKPLIPWATTSIVGPDAAEDVMVGQMIAARRPIRYHYTPHQGIFTGVTWADVDDEKLLQEVSKNFDIVTVGNPVRDPRNGKELPPDKPRQAVVAKKILDYAMAPATT